MNLSSFFDWGSNLFGEGFTSTVQRAVASIFNKDAKKPKMGRGLRRKQHFAQLRGRNLITASTASTTNQDDEEEKIAIDFNQPAGPIQLGNFQPQFEEQSKLQQMENELRNLRREVAVLKQQSAEQERQKQEQEAQRSKFWLVDSPNLTRFAAQAKVTATRPSPIHYKDAEGSEEEEEEEEKEKGDEDSEESEEGEEEESEEEEESSSESDDISFIVHPIFGDSDFDDDSYEEVDNEEDEEEEEGEEENGEGKVLKESETNESDDESDSEERWNEWQKGHETNKKRKRAHAEDEEEDEDEEEGEDVMPAVDEKMEVHGKISSESESSLSDDEAESKESENAADENEKEDEKEKEKEKEEEIIIDDDVNETGGVKIGNGHTSKNNGIDTSVPPQWIHKKHHHNNNAEEREDVQRSTKKRKLESLEALNNKEYAAKLRAYNKLRKSRSEGEEEFSEGGNDADDEQESETTEGDGPEKKVSMKERLRRGKRRLRQGQWPRTPGKTPTLRLTRRDSVAGILFEGLKKKFQNVRDQSFEEQSSLDQSLWK